MNKEKPMVKMPNEEFDKFMCQKFPELFQDRNKPMSETCMCWGFDTGEGWNQILYDLCEKLDFIRSQTGIITVFDQIKEKFGGGRFYYHIEYDDKFPCKLQDHIREIWCNFISEAVDKAERESECTCGICGEQYFHDKISVGGWVYDTCKDCMLKDTGNSRFKDLAERLEQKEKRDDRLWQLKCKIERMKNEELSLVEKTCDEIEARTKTIVT